MKITSRVKAEFAFYRDTPLDMIGHGDAEDSAIAELATDSGRSALDCYFLFDAHGKMAACREPDLFRKVLRGKKSVNLQIKLWAEDMADGLLLRQVELVEYVHGWPGWVLRAVMEQAGRIATRNTGFAPRFARAEYLWGNLWLPEMDGFDAAI